MHGFGTINWVILSTQKDTPPLSLIWVRDILEMSELFFRAIERLFWRVALKGLLLLFSCERLIILVDKVRGDQVRKMVQVEVVSMEVVQEQIHFLGLGTDWGKWAVSISCNCLWVLDFQIVVFLPEKGFHVKFVSAFLLCVIGRCIC